MMADNFDKPLQGGRFHAFRYKIMVIPNKVSVPRPSPHSFTKYLRVEKSNELKYYIETNHTNIPRVLSAGVCWDYVNPYEILFSS